MLGRDGRIVVFRGGEDDLARVRVGGRVRVRVRVKVRARVRVQVRGWG